MIHVTFIQQHALSSSEENERRTTKNNGKRSTELITDTLEYALGCERVVSRVIKS